MTAVATIHASKSASLVGRFAERFGVQADKMLATLKQTCFRIPPGKNGEQREATNEEMMALLVVADQYGLNPFTKEIYAFPDSQRGGIVPVVSVDGWTRIINQHPAMNGIEFRYSDSTAKIDDHHKPCPDWCEAVIYRKDRHQPIVIREYLDEVYRPPFEGTGRNGAYVKAGPWQSHTKRFLRHKTLIQAARVAFGFAGIYDEDEAERIQESRIIEHGHPQQPAIDGDLMPKAVTQDAKPITIPAQVVEAARETVEAEQRAEFADNVAEAKRQARVAAEETAPAPSINANMAAVLRTKMGQSGVKEAALCQQFGIDSLELLPASKINIALKHASGQA
jgi:phage recombination protein Bet